ncbi:MAG: type I methionyl aminopeptidase [Oscillospiraceae bacterium]|jgi:methionyl aminopeptidase|nr:type I methionyl aminopeptidase [Oscillospiraceae bacterium]
MITLKNAEQAAKMRRAGHLLEDVMTELCAAVAPGVTTLAIDRLAERLIRQNGAIPSFLGYEGFPASVCTSLDDAVVHGFPEDKPLREGQILGLDCGLILDGWQSDMARTMPVGKISPEAERLIAVTRECFFRALAVCRPGYRLGDIGHAVQSHAEAAGYSVVRDLCGHGIGREMHEAPEVAMFGTPGHGIRLRPGMTIAIEPMINAGGWQVNINGWDARTRDGSLSAHYENTVLITAGDPEVLTMKAMETQG